MALVSLDGRFLRVNRAFCAVVGYEPAELTNLTFQGHHPPRGPRYRSCSFGAAALAVRSHDASSKSATSARTGRSSTSCSGRRSFVTAPARPSTTSLRFEDITERKRVEKELRDANAFLDAIIENIPLMLFIKDSASLRFVRFNRAGEDLLGWPRQSLVGKNDFDFWPREQAEFFVQKDRETMKRGNVVDIDEEPIQTRHQGVRILHTKKVPILDPSGNPLYLLGISEDITERRRLEEGTALAGRSQRRAVRLARLRADVRDRDPAGRSTVSLTGAPSIWWRSMGTSGD